MGEGLGGGDAAQPLLILYARSINQSAFSPRSCSAAKCKFPQVRRRQDASSRLDLRGGEHHLTLTLGGHDDFNRTFIAVSAINPQE